MKPENARRWRVPLAISLLLNFCTFAYVGGWFASMRIDAPHAMVRVRSLHLVHPPQIALKPQQEIVKAKPEPKRPRPEEVLHPRSLASVTHNGAHRVPHRIVRVASAAPTAPRVTLQPAADRDPFQPDIAPAAVFKPAPRATRVVPVPSAPKPAPRPTQIASVSGAGAPSAPTPVVSPSPSALPGPQRPGVGGNGTGDRGNGNGAGGVLPFGLGGRGGSGDHHIVYVLDVSPSMTTRIDRARAELRSAMANLDENDLFDIFIFGGHVEQMEPYLEPATPDSLREANWFLNHINFIQSTNLEEALTEALDMRHVNEIVLITDGVPTSGELDFRALAREIRNRNIDRVRIDTIGLVGINPDGTDQSFEASSLLRQIARDSGGECRFVPLGEATPD